MELLMCEILNMHSSLCARHCARTSRVMDMGDSDYVNIVHSERRVENIFIACFIAFSDLDPLLLFSVLFLPDPITYFNLCSGSVRKEPS